MPARSRRWSAWCARTSRSSPRSSRCILNSFFRRRRSPTPRRKSSSALEPGGAAVINRDNPHYQCANARGRSRRHPDRFVRRKCARRCAASQMRPAADCSTVEADILGVPVAYKIGAPGRHLVMNSLAVLAAASLCGADLARAALALAQQAPAAGRGTRITLELPGGPGARYRRELQRQSDVDARRARAARPGAARPRAAAASRCSATCWNSARRRGPAPRPGRSDRRERDRSGILRRSADGGAVAGSSLAPAAAMRIARPSSNRRSWRRSAAATPSWSRHPPARAWDRS